MLICCSLENYFFKQKIVTEISDQKLTTVSPNYSNKVKTKQSLLKSSMGGCCGKKKEEEEEAAEANPTPEGEEGQEAQPEGVQSASDEQQPSASQTGSAIASKTSQSGSKIDEKM